MSRLDGLERQLDATERARAIVAAAQAGRTPAPSLWQAPAEQVVTFEALLRRCSGLDVGGRTLMLVHERSLRALSAWLACRAALTLARCSAQGVAVPADDLARAADGAHEYLVSGLAELGPEVRVVAGAVGALAQTLEADLLMPPVRAVLDANLVELARLERAIGTTPSDPSPALRAAVATTLDAPEAPHA